MKAIYMPSFYIKLILSLLISLCIFPVYAESFGLGEVAGQITGGPVDFLKQSIYGMFFVAGAAFLVGTMSQYKNHRENPQQIRLSIPITYFIMSLVLFAIPTIAILVERGYL